MRKLYIVLITHVFFIGGILAQRNASTPMNFHITTEEHVQQDLTTPTCEILSPKTGSTYSGNTISLRYLVDIKQNIPYKVKFLVAGKEVVPIQSNSSDGSTSKGAVLAGVEVELPMPQEMNREVAVSIQLVNSSGLMPEPKTIMLRYVGEMPKPTLHIFAVGISEYPASDLPNLNYAAKDAEDFVETITTSDLSMYRECLPTLIRNKEATTRNLRKELMQVKNRVSQEDVVMLFFSGHGMHQNKKSYFLTSDVSAEDYYNGLDFSFIRDCMTEMANNKKCRVIVFMDACHSGAMYNTKGTVQDITFASPGIIGFYSSTAGELSAEERSLQNGVFTRVLLDGLKGKAVDSEGQITIHTLETYVKQQVREQTHNRQTPIIENATGNAVLFYTKKQ